MSGNFLPGPVVPTVACLTEKSDLSGLIPGLALNFLEIDHGIFLRSLARLNKVQEELLYYPRSQR